MSRSNKHIDDSIKNTLEQHEFDFDLSAWEAMDKKLDDRENSGGGGNISDTTTKGQATNNWKGFIGFLFILVLFSFIAWNISFNDANSSNQSTLKERSIPSEEKVDQSISSNEKEAKTIEKSTTDLKTKIAQVEYTDTDSKRNASHDSESISNLPKSTKENALTESNTQNIAVGHSANTLIKKSHSSSHSTNTLTGQEKNSDDLIPNQKGTGTAITNNSSTGRVLDADPASNIGIKVENNDQSTNSNLTPVTKSTKTEVVLNPPLTSSLNERSSLNTFTKLPSAPLEEVVVGNNSQEKIGTHFSNFKKETIRLPNRWYSEVQLGAYFPSFRNGTTYIDRTTELDRRVIKKQFYFATKAGYRWHPQSSIELGLSYVALPFSYEYSYNSDPTNDLAQKTESLDQQVHQFSIPLTWQVQVKEDLRLFIGAGASIRRLNKNKNAEYTPPVLGEEIYNLTKDIYQPVLGFWETGLGYDRGLWSLDLKYQRFFTPSFKTFEYLGEQRSNRARESNFILAFGRRLQKYQDPKQIIRSRINQTNSPSPDLGFDWGVGIAAGSEKYRGNANFLPDNTAFALTDFTTPVKLGIWGSYDIVPRIRIQSELWAQKTAFNYELTYSNIDVNGNVIIKKIKNDLEMTRLEIPLSFHYKLKKHLRLIGGLGMEFNFAKKVNPTELADYEELATIVEDLPNMVKKGNLFYDLGIGYDWKQFSFDLNYRKSLFRQNQVFKYRNPDTETYFSDYSDKEQVVVSMRVAF